MPALSFLFRGSTWGRILDPFEFDSVVLGASCTCSDFIHFLVYLVGADVPADSSLLFVELLGFDGAVLEVSDIGDVLAIMMF